jgi:salicylate hydroxylase
VCIKRIAVIGCGPGGLASALFLHRAGHDVTLFDQFDTPRPLGSGLLIQPSGQVVLQKLGLLAEVEKRAALVTGLCGINVVNGKRALDMEYRHLKVDAHALGIHRASLFGILFDAVRKVEIKLRTNCTLRSVDVLAAGAVPQFEEQSLDQEPYDLIIDASGAHGPLVQGKCTDLPFAALWTTVDIPPGTNIAVAALDQRYVASHKMAGIMPIGINPETGNAGAALFWSIKPDGISAQKKRGIGAWRNEFLAVWPEAIEFVDHVRSFDDLTLAIYRHRTGEPVSRRRIFHIGDSWHCTSPQLGQGANMALIDAAAVALAIQEADDIDEIARYYRYLRADHVGLYQLLSRVFTPLYQSDSRLLPAIRDAVIHNLARLPAVRNVIADVVSGNLGNFAET